MSLDSVSSIYIYMESPHSQSRTRMSSWSCSKRLQEPENLICKDPRPKYGPAKLVTFCGGRMSIPGMMGRDKDAESLDIVSVCLSWHLEIPIAHGKMDENGRYCRDIMQKQRDYPLTLSIARFQGDICHRSLAIPRVPRIPQIPRSPRAADEA